MKINVEFSKTNSNLDARLGAIQIVTEFVGGEHYEGNYDITPKVEKQTMPTKKKVMLDDVTIHAIPFYEVSNHTGGNTIYIAGEIEME